MKASEAIKLHNKLHIFGKKYYFGLQLLRLYYILGLKNKKGYSALRKQLFKKKNIWL